MATMSPCTIEMIYPSGHRQIWRRIHLTTPPTDFYECETFCPDGHSVELRILSSKQLERTSKRVRGLGGTVRHHEGGTGSGSK